VPAKEQDMLPIAFLGICDASNAYADGGHEVLWRQNILGLRTHLVSPVFPLSLAGAQFVFALYDPSSLSKIRVDFFDEAGQSQLFFEIEVGVVPAEARTGLLSVGHPTAGAVGAASIFRADAKGWTVLTLVGPRDATIMKPGTFRARATLDGITEEVGYLDCLVFTPRPMDDQVKAAIRADPMAARQVRLHSSCKICEDGWKAYAALEKDPELERSGYQWYTALPSTWTCGCGKTTLDLGLVRANLHGLLGRHLRPSGDIALVPLYQAQALEQVLHAFSALLDSDPDEERVQEFLTANPVILGQFSPLRLEPKAPILSKHKTDFVILNHRSELLLIELERPSCKIMKADGGASAQLQTPLNQINDWFHEVEEHRGAVLSCLGIPPSDVAKVRGVVIAGRNKDYDPEALRKLKKRTFDQRIDVLTYDDLIKGFVGIIRHFGIKA
jgi:hypothetical protein